MKKYQGCSYYTCFNTSITNSKSVEIEKSKTKSQIRKQDQLSRNGLDPNSWVQIRKTMVLELVPLVLIPV